MKNESLKQSWATATQRLSHHGFSGIAVIEPASLPAQLRQELAVPNGDLLVLTAASGERLWHALQQTRHTSHNDPVDSYSAACLADALDNCTAVERWTLQYPGDGPAPLMALGAWLGWTSPSPLGIGIHSQHGLWFAWRALALVTPVSDNAIPVNDPSPATSPCVSCADTPCVAACPAGAVSERQAFDLQACLDYRLADESPCASSCLARLACPVGGASRYPADQFAYHQTRALDGMKRWLKNR